MSVETTTRSVDYTSDGSTTAYAVNFPFLETEHLIVQQITSGGSPVTTTLTENSQYTVSGTRDGAGYSSGTVTLTTALTSGYTLRIRRTLPIKQLVDLRAQGTFSPGTHEYMADYLTMCLQQLNDGEISVDSYVAGETNTASNVNTAGVGVFKQKVGVDFQFRGIKAADTTIDVSLDAATNEIRVGLGTVPSSELTDGPIHATYNWNSSNSNWDRANHVGSQLPATASRTAAGKAKITFTTPYASLKYGVAVTYATTSGAAGYAPRVNKNTDYVEVWLYEATALADDIDFEIVITPNLS